MSIGKALLLQTRNEAEENVPVLLDKKRPSFRPSQLPFIIKFCIYIVHNSHLFPFVPGNSGGLYFVLNLGAVPLLVPRIAAIVWV